MQPEGGGPGAVARGADAGGLHLAGALVGARHQPGADQAASAGG